jgi:hypothetical protein
MERKGNRDTGSLVTWGRGRGLEEEEAVRQPTVECLHGAGFGNRRGIEGGAHCPEDEEENIIHEGTMATN